MAMGFKNKRRWRIIAIYCIAWTFALIFLSIVRGIGTTENGAIDIGFIPGILFTLVLAPIFGTISAGIQILTGEKLYRRTSARKLFFIRLIVSILFLIIIVLIAYLIFPSFLNIKISLKDFVLDKGSFPIYFYIFCVDVFLAATMQISLMLGGNNLWKILLGKFYTPHEENRIFMFLDLQSSTQYAETLGHIKYSMFIQDCFNDLGVVIEDEADIYQYVGDEVILTWKLEDGLRNQNCIHAFFRFKNQLLKREAYYKKTYGCTPFFKAGVNDGVVTATEVGKYKKEIAYHGDTLNTAARIQGKCNEFNQELLISESLKNKLDMTHYHYDLLGNVALRGKNTDVQIYSVSQ